MEDQHEEEWAAEAGVKKPQLSSGDRIRGKSGRIKLIRRITLHFCFCNDC